MRSLKKAIFSTLDSVLPDRIKCAMFHLSFQLARAEFERFAYEYGQAPNMRFGLEAIARRGFAPRSIIDVGAFEGSWSKLAKEIWPHCQLYMIEPNQRKKAQIEAVADRLGAHCFYDIVGAEDGREVRFHVMESGSSIMSERSPLPRVVELRRLRTLDCLLVNLDGPGLLKIDAQGYELEILKGATAILPRFEAVLLEISTIEINEGAPLLHDVIVYLKREGFVAYDILEIHRRPLDGALNQVDVLFIREQSRLVADRRHFA